MVIIFDIEYTKHLNRCVRECIADRDSLTRLLNVMCAMRLANKTSLTYAQYIIFDIYCAYFDTFVHILLLFVHVMTLLSIF